MLGIDLTSCPLQAQHAYCVMRFCALTHCTLIASGYHVPQPLGRTTCGEFIDELPVVSTYFITTTTTTTITLLLGMERQKEMR